MTRTCRYQPCSKEFTPTHWRQEYCEPKCRNDNHYLTHPEKGRRLGPDGVLRLTATQATGRRPSRDGKGTKAEQVKNELDQCDQAIEYWFRRIKETVPGAETPCSRLDELLDGVRDVVGDLGGLVDERTDGRAA